jgi:pyrrolidone-carboxylate peptidase
VATPHAPTLRAAATALALSVAGCGAADDAAADEAPEADAVTVDTGSPAARAQYDANVSFALRYRARCVRSPGARRRVLVTGFGRFLDSGVNVSGQVVSALVPGLRYPVTRQPTDGGPDDPAPQTAVAQATVTLPAVGAVDVCAMVVPVYWDLAAILALKEAEGFAPDLVVMNGIAGPAQPLWIELGSVNRAMTLRDGSDLLVPRAPAGQAYAPLVPSATAAERARGLLLSWDAVRSAAEAAIDARAAVTADGRALADVLTGVQFGGFPRDSNTYLCNNVTYVVSYAMDHPGRTLTLLQASTARRGFPNRVAVRLTRDLRAAPRVFVHWPSLLAGPQLDAGAAVLRAMIDAQLAALDGRGAAPTRGDNARADLVASGDTF